MRGNHRIIGRNDHIEPEPISPDDWLAVDAVKVVLSPGKKTWFDVFQGEQKMGCVTTKASGQCFRTPEMDDWLFVTHKWNENDPPHGRAIIALMQWHKMRIDEQAHDNRDDGSLTQDCGMLR